MARTKRRDEDADDDVLRDGERMTVKMSAMDSLQRDVAAHYGSLRTQDARARGFGLTDALQLNRPGYRHNTNDAANDARERAYAQRDREDAEAWRGGTGSFSGAPKVGTFPISNTLRPGMSCTVRSGGVAEGSPGVLVETSPGWLECQPVERQDARRDSKPVRDVVAEYAAYDSWIQNAWRGDGQ